MSSALQKRYDFVEPILKWPGGKRWLASLLADQIRNELKNCYYEPVRFQPPQLLRKSSGWATPARPFVLSARRSARASAGSPKPAYHPGCSAKAMRE